MGIDPAFADQQGSFGGKADQPFGGGKIGDEAFEIAVVDPDQAAVEGGGAGHLGLIVNLDQHVHSVFERGGLDLGHLRIVQCGDDNQDRIGADRAGLGNLPWINHEVLAQHRQRAGGAGGDQVILMALKEWRVGQNRKAGSATRLVSPGMISGIEIGADQAL